MNRTHAMKVNLRKILHYKFEAGNPIKYFRQCLSRFKPHHVLFIRNPFEFVEEKNIRNYIRHMEYDRESSLDCKQRS